MPFNIPPPAQEALTQAKAGIERVRRAGSEHDVAEPNSSDCLLPGPGEPFETTRQLAYGLALLQDSVQESDLSPDSLEWRRSTLHNSDEKERLETISIKVLHTFAKDTTKDVAAVYEVVQLAPVLDGDYYRFPLKTFIDTVYQAKVLNLCMLEGLAKMIQGAAPGYIDSDDLARILASLHKRLQSTPSKSHRDRYNLLLAVSRILDAMVDANIGDIGRVNLHGPLTSLLQESESSNDLYLTFQAAYAMQALLNVSDDDHIWRAGFRRVWPIQKGGTRYTAVPDLKDELDILETLYEAGKGSLKLLKNTLEAIKSRESPTFSVKDGLQFKKAWYRAIRMAESYIGLGRLTLFKDLVTKAPCRDDFMFQWGVCQLLGLFAADASLWDQEARQEAIDFLEALYKDTGLWNRQKGVDQVILDALTNVMSSNDRHLEAANSLLVDMRKQCPTLEPMVEPQSPLWSNIRLADPSRGTDSHITLLKAVQDQSHWQAKMENLPYQSPEPGLDVVRAALMTYHAQDLSILRVSRDKLDLETCFVNLAIVEAPAQREKEKNDLKDQGAVFYRISSFEKVENTDTQSLIPLEQLFNRRKLRDGREDVPKRILIQGRAGVGKSTLCKKLVHAHQNGLWDDMFETVLRISLRQLRGFKGSTLESLFREKVFIAQDSNQEQAELAKALADRAKNGKVLFILDGLDEIVSNTEDGDRLDLRSLLMTLISQQHVIITTRPSGFYIELLQEIDLVLETIGFSQQNVNDFLVNVLKPDAAETVQSFIRQTPLIQGLVNIPGQLDVICYSLDSLQRVDLAVTISGLYQMMEQNLWCKDALRLKKTCNGMGLTERQLNNFSPKMINELMAAETQYLGYLAFEGMINNHQVEFDERDLFKAFDDLEDEAAGNQRHPPHEQVDLMKESSFLHTSNVNLDFRGDYSRQTWHFLHLTFQEYFAATWIVRHFQRKQPSSTAGMMAMDQMTVFVHQHKYNPQYEIVWKMVAGLLEGEPLSEFFDLLQGAPRDLIGGRHQQILASCLNEARTRLDSAVVAELDKELEKWLRCEMQAC